MKNVFAIIKSYTSWKLSDHTGSEWAIVRVNSRMGTRCVVVRDIPREKAQEYIKRYKMDEVIRSEDGLVYELPNASFKEYCDRLGLRSSIAS